MRQMYIIQRRNLTRMIILTGKKTRRCSCISFSFKGIIPCNSMKIIVAYTKNQNIFNEINMITITLLTVTCFNYKKDTDTNTDTGQL